MKKKKKKKNNQKSKKKRKHQQEHDNQESKKPKIQEDKHDNLFGSSDEEADQEDSDEDFDDFSGTDSDICVDTVQYQWIMKLIKDVSKRCKHDEELFDKVQNFMQDIALPRIGYYDDWDGMNNDAHHDNPIRLIGNGPVVQHKKLESCTDNQAVPLLLKELNQKYHDCLSLCENTETTIQIDMEHFF